VRVPALDAGHDGQAFVLVKKRCSGWNDSRPIWTCSAGRARMLRIQSVSLTQVEQMTASRVRGS
jgi:hypothetical protein